MVTGTAVMATVFTMSSTSVTSHFIWRFLSLLLAGRRLEGDHRGAFHGQARELVAGPIAVGSCVGGRATAPPQHPGLRSTPLGLVEAVMWKR